MDNLEPLVISFEFFPPKTPDGMANLQATAQSLANLKPDYFSMTFGAGGSTREGTLGSVAMLQEKTTIPVAPHIACTGLNRKEITHILLKYKADGVKRIVALRGDIPSGMGRSGEVRYASELVSLIREVTGDHFHIEVAAYPECHPQAKNAQDDVLNLKRKVAAGANSAITQYFFNPDAYFYFLDACAKQQIFIPVVPGIMPITQFSKLQRFSELCGAEIPRWLCKQLETYADDQESIAAFGLEVVYNLCQRLIAGGAPGLHFYTLNRGDVCMTLLANLSMAYAREDARVSTRTV